MNILFSPIGNTDPIANDLDGAMLHICRHYPIDMVVMYMSKEICTHHHEDNRYIITLDQLSEHLGRKIKHEIIECPELEDVQKFDYFINEFKEILMDIHIRYPQAKLYLNVSSGTPAMKSALQILSAYREIDYLPVQVSGPGYRENRKPFDLASAFDEDYDNIPESENRCSISTNLNLLAETKKKMISVLIDKYDYAGALALTDGMDELSEDFKNMLKGADLRYKFELNEARAYFKKADCNNTLFSNTAEYLLIMWVKNERDEIADFLRAITPIAFALNKEVLKVRYKFDIEKYTINTDTGLRWSSKKIKDAKKTDPVAAKVSAVFDEKWDNKYVITSHINVIINNISNESNVIKMFNKIREVEVERNQIAHYMKSINRKDLHDNKIGSIKSIIDKLYSACVMTELISIPKENDAKNYQNIFFRSYPDMNQKLKELLD